MHVAKEATDLEDGELREDVGKEDALLTDEWFLLMDVVGARVVTYDGEAVGGGWDGGVLVGAEGGLAKFLDGFLQVEVIEVTHWIGCRVWF